MEKDIPVAGGLADVEVKIEGGKLSISESIDLGVLVDKLEALVEAKFPAGAPIEKSVFALLKAALIAL